MWKDEDKYKDWNKVIDAMGIIRNYCDNTDCEDCKIKEQCCHEPNCWEL